MTAILFFAAWAHAVPGYDEAYDSRGHMRPAYRALLRREGVNVLEPTADVTAFMMNSPLDDSQKGWPVPLVLSAEEYGAIQKGVARRAEVYRLFFHDLVMGEQRVRSILSPAEFATIERAFFDSGASLAYLRQTYRGMPLSSVRFLYGPDLIRGADGRWLVLEDNVGDGPGGLADADALRKYFQIESGLSFGPREIPYEFLGEAVRSFLEDVEKSAGEPMMFSTVRRQPLTSSDLEHKRILDAFGRYGIAREWTDAEGDHVTGLGRHASHLFLLDNPASFSGSTMLRLTQWAMLGNMEFFITPGIEALTTKAILPLMDRLAEFYLKEELSLKSAKTFAITNDSDFAAVIDDYGAHLVVKENFGRAGSEVYFLDQMDEDQREELISRLEDQHASNLLDTGYATTAFVAQPFVESSHLTFGGRRNRVNGRVDIRPLTYVGPKRTIVTEYPWGRVSSPFGSRRHNVSLGAQQMVVLVNCETALTGR